MDIEINTPVPTPNYPEPHPDAHPPIPESQADSTPPLIKPYGLNPPLTENDADFFRRLAQEMRGFDIKPKDHAELRRRRLYSALVQFYIQYMLYLRGRKWPLAVPVLNISLDIGNTRMEDLEKLYARIVFYCEHQGMYVDDRHILAPWHLGQALSYTLTDED